MRRRALAALSTAIALIAGAVVAPSVAQAADNSVIWDSESCTEQFIPANDDGSSSRVTLPFELNFYGKTYSELWVNNNGNVTFDGPLATYTPFGLAATSTPIIAPFFADVDTRGSGSGITTFGYGETKYNGRSAFCVNWIDVGYFGANVDKLNSFQLLLVARPASGPGAFDIVFNYESIQWETGDASGGIGGLGGVSARAGFSSGTGVTGTSTELPGSGKPGAFLDTSSTGLVHSSLGSPLPGRYTFNVRNHGVVADTYVALGDSFQSGEGAFIYEAGTDEQGVNICHRAPTAYPQLLVDRGAVLLDLDFRACSNAYIRHVVGGQWNESAQTNALGPDTRLVTIGIVGNDLGFSSTMQRCVAENFLGGPVSPLWTQFGGACKALESGTANDSLDSLAGGQLRTDLLALYRLIRAKAPYARIVVVSYPQFFPGAGRLTAPCNLLWAADQRWLNNLVTRLDDEIDLLARVAGLESVHMADVLDGHGTCSGEPGMNGIRLDGTEVLFESFHPNQLGHELMADRVQAHLRTTVRPTFAILPEQTVVKKFTVAGRTMSVNVAWPGSDVVTTLISPSGRAYTREDVGDAEHGNGPTYEYWTIAAPEPGEWTVSIYGADVAEDGEDVVLDMFEEPARNEAPVAVVSSKGSGATWTFDGTGSTDVDGAVTGYEWYFSDGGTATGPVVTHTFTTEGPHRVSLVVTDDANGEGFGASEVLTPVDAVRPESAVLYSGSDLALTNAVRAQGDVVVGGAVQCDSTALVEGDLVATGDVYLTNSCQVLGDVRAGGDVTMDSSARVGGDLHAVGRVSLTSGVRVGGEVRAPQVEALDGAALPELVRKGILGEVVIDPDVPEVRVAVPAAVATEPVDYAGSRWLTWQQWLNETAHAAAAPPWSQARTSRPGCVVAPWGASVNTRRIDIASSTVIDARTSTSGCASVTFQDMSLRVMGDVVVLADDVQIINGLTITSGDGREHSVRILVPGASGGVAAHNGLTSDGLTRVELLAPGRVTVNGPADFVGALRGGALRLTGGVSVVDR